MNMELGIRERARESLWLICSLADLLHLQGDTLTRDHRGQLSALIKDQARNLEKLFDAEETAPVRSQPAARRYGRRGWLTQPGPTSDA